MTLIASVITPEISLLLGDARLTLPKQPLARRYIDCCQKVFALSESTIMGFAGDVRPAGELLASLPWVRSADGAMNIAVSMCWEFQLLAAQHAERGTPPHASFGTILHGMYVDSKRIDPVQFSATGITTGRHGHSPFSGAYSVSYKRGRFFIQAGEQSAMLVFPYEFLENPEMIAPGHRRIDPHPCAGESRSRPASLLRKLRKLFISD